MKQTMILLPSHNSHLNTTPDIILIPVFESLCVLQSPVYRSVKVKSYGKPSCCLCNFVRLCKVKVNFFFKYIIKKKATKHILFFIQTFLLLFTNFTNWLFYYHKM